MAIPQLWKPTIEGARMLLLFALLVSLLEPTVAVSDVVPGVDGDVTVTITCAVAALANVAALQSTDVDVFVQVIGPVTLIAVIVAPVDTNACSVMLLAGSLPVFVVLMSELKLEPEMTLAGPVAPTDIAGLVWTAVRTTSLPLSACV